MKVCEFIELAKDNASSTELFNHIEIKEYLPLLVKKALADQMTEKQINFINGLACTDNFYNEILLDITIIEAYTDLTFSSDNSIAEYEEMVTLGLTEMLKLGIGDDCELVREYFYTRINEIMKLFNSLEGMLSRQLEVITRKVVETLDIVQKNVDKETVTEVLNSFQYFNLIQDFDLNNVLDFTKLLSGRKRKK